MDHGQDKGDEMVLALLSLTMFSDEDDYRAWKGQDWDALHRLYQKGYIWDPKNKAKSVVVTEQGAQRARELFEKHFGLSGQGAPKRQTGLRRVLRTRAQAPASLMFARDDIMPGNFL